MLRPRSHGNVSGSRPPRPVPDARGRGFTHVQPPPRESSPRHPAASPSRIEACGFDICHSISPLVKPPSGGRNFRQWPPPELAGVSGISPPLIFGTMLLQPLRRAGESGHSGHVKLSLRRCRGVRPADGRGGLRVGQVHLSLLISEFRYGHPGNDAVYTHPQLHGGSDRCCSGGSVCVRSGRPGVGRACSDVRKTFHPIRSRHPADPVRSLLQVSRPR